jgi:DNA primase
MNWMQELTSFAAAQVDERVRDALLGRGVSDEQIAQYQIGHLNKLLPDGVSDNFRKWAVGKLDDVLLFPLTNSVGEVLGFQVRSLAQGKRGYSDYLPEKREACLFGLGQALPKMWETRSVFLVEGAFDLFPVQRAFPPVVATLTAGVAPSLARLLRRTVDRVWMGYDMDAPGRRGCDYFARVHGHDFQVYIVKYPNLEGVKDPGDLWEAWGDSRVIPFIQDLVRPKTPFE